MAASAGGLELATSLPISSPNAVCNGPAVAARRQQDAAFGGQIRMARRPGARRDSAPLLRKTPTIPILQIGIVAVLHMNRFLMFVFIAAGLWSLAVSADQADGWQIGPLARPSGTYPVITPNKDSLFRNPVDGKLVHWEALHTFNPAAMEIGRASCRERV